ncbi:unnamed protein product [Didymodactylos carnosus]|uniref:Sodium/glucose cotransporter 4 n=1 Tax=Didymodactylos carnosus TaxID=1234261 RepID=A0A814P151_9BILA|nr:unnamed protein product [Didymodactylos carnosus]CAF1100147.1 unnamed protein product [Didymodactylos carnosus]CAF3763704.1 unnamed protein product [Didymodactylos carnosus]CAF3865153.1 unnamed protein product [Didymodactylos carnosus]
MVARILYPDEIGCADPVTCYQVCHSANGCNDIAYPLLVIRLMPNAIRGLTLACMIAALMSSLTSIFNSSSTIFTIDIWQRFRRNAPQYELMIVGRVFVMLLVTVSILWIPIIKASQGSRLFDYIQAVQSFLAPPVAACYLLGVLWKRINEEGAFWGLVVGLIVGVIRFIWEYSYSAMPCALEHLDQRPSVIKFNFLYFSILLFFISATVTIVVSLITRPLPEQYVLRKIDISKRMLLICIFVVLQISGLTMFDLDNPNKPLEIPTLPGFFHKADTRFPIQNYLIKKKESVHHNPALHLFNTEDTTGTLYYIKVALSWICGIEKQINLDDKQIEAVDVSIKRDEENEQRLVSTQYVREQSAKYLIISIVL